MSSKDYWDKRTNKLSSVTDKTIQTTEARVQKYYIQTYKDIDSKVAKLYSEYQDLILSGKEPSISTIHQMEHYWELKVQIEEEINKLGVKTNSSLTNALEAQYKVIYNSISIDSVVEAPFKKMSKEYLEQAVNGIWSSDGYGFSDRIWASKKNLMNALDETIVTGLTEGKSYLKMSKDIADRLSVDSSNASRLVRTECAHIETKAAVDRYKDYGIEKVEILTGAGCCDECEELEGKEFDITEAENLVPVHPNCRCAVSPIIKKRDDV